jgi:Tfp pilus assembly protein PilN
VRNINLTPEEELENPMWFVPDVGVCLLVMACLYLGIQYYYSHKKEYADEKLREKSRIEQRSAEFSTQLAEYEKTRADLQSVQNQLADIQIITAADTLRHKPLIILEHLQALRPEGLWLQDLNLNNSPKKDPAGAPAPVQAQTNPDGTTIDPQVSVAARTNLQSDVLTFTGYALDSLLISEFMAALKATKTMEAKSGDLRSQVFFDEVELKGVAQEGHEKAFGGVFPSDDPAIPRIVRFEFELKAVHQIVDPKQSLMLSLHSMEGAPSGI